MKTLSICQRYPWPQKAQKLNNQVDSPLGGECATSDHPRWNSHSTHYGFDEFGFSALPGGYRHYFGSLNDIGRYGGWWSSTELSSAYAWYRRMGSVDACVGRYFNFEKDGGFSVRCVRDVD